MTAAAAPPMSGIAREAWPRMLPDSVATMDTLMRGGLCPGFETS
jgi:hypothetical protein